MLHDDILLLKDEVGQEIEFEYLDTIQFNQQEYVVLLPTHTEPDEEGEVVILQVKTEGDSNTEVYLPVESEEVLESVFESFKERIKDEFDQ